ncbi:hypothetical protein NLI96_g9238 [Meripilus lineatus]|uniref:Uncharacterized protein n=1 Tax=Meripilus lineatus TaxID=2056292 RepID=A0AAD5UW34_9APHY|nr:hypothetical protein NLI96_g9238 [Physisporinus lineatus]
MIPPSVVSSPSWDARVLANIDDSSTSFLKLVDQYVDRSGTVLDVPLPYESRPTSGRRVQFDASDNGVFMISHALRHESQHRVTVCSGFALNVAQTSDHSDSPMIVSCAHTLEEVRHSRAMSSLAMANTPGAQPPKPSISGSFLISGTHDSPRFHPVSAIHSALHKADLLLLSASTPGLSLPTLPVSPYPVHPGAAIRAHFVTDKQPEEDGWRPWIGHTWSKWVKGTVLGYRDFAGREAKPGTYDALSHLLFKPLPTPGSSGGPIVDEESGAVVGIMLGTRMDNRIEGVRGWGVPAETIFEMFSLPGLDLKKKAV